MRFEILEAYLYSKTLLDIEKGKHQDDFLNLHFCLHFMLLENFKCVISDFFSYTTFVGTILSRP